MDKVDLLNAVNYSTLRNAIHRWCPWQANQQKCCIQVQQSLLTLLPVARQKQELRQLCQEYKNHLAVEIESQAKKRHWAKLFYRRPIAEHYCLLRRR